MSKIYIQESRYEKINLKMGYRSKQRYLNRRISNEWKTFKEMFNILRNQANATTLRFNLTPVRMLKRNIPSDVGKRLGKGNRFQFLVRVYIFTVTMENQFPFFLRIIKISLLKTQLYYSLPVLKRCFTLTKNSWSTKGTT